MEFNMKKGLLAVAVAGALTMGAAQAETSIYGSIRYDYNNMKTASVTEKNDKGEATKVERKRVSDLQDRGSRLGIKGSEDLGNGLALVFKVEFGYNGMEGLSKNDKGFHNRLAMIGLAGDWGTFAVGRLDNPFKQTIVDGSVIDDFNSTWSNSSANAAFNKGFLGADSYTANGVNGTLDRVGNALAYISPEFSGFSMNAAVIMDHNLELGDETATGVKVKEGDFNRNKHVDVWTINAQYQHELGFYGKAGFIQGKLTDQEKNSRAWGAQLGYKQDQFGVTFAYADAKLDKNKDKGWDLGGYFAFGNDYSSTVRVSYGEDKHKNPGQLDNKSMKTKRWALGFQQDLSERTRVWVEYGQEKAKDQQKEDGISIGIRHDF